MSLSRQDALETLRWLIEAGADETLAEEPVNRFAARAQAAASRAAAPPSAIALRKESPAPNAPVAAPSGEREIRRVPVMDAAEAVSLSTVPGAARALAASCRSLSELKHAIQNFDRIDLKRSARNLVFADGDPSGRIMLIGEAPGAEEDEKGVPFVGRAGKLLDRMLEAIGLDRRKVYITNVMNWRPPQNREPTPEEASALQPFLHRHIELADPAIIVLLGAVSCRHVLGLNEGITRLRGRWEVYQSGVLNRAIPVMPTLHPAYLLRQPIGKRHAWRDLCAVADKIQSLGLA